MATGIQLSALLALGSLFVWLTQPIKSDITNLKGELDKRIVETRAAHDRNDIEIKNSLEKIGTLIEDLKAFRIDSTADRATIHQSIASIRQEATAAGVLNDTVHTQVKEEIDRDKREHKELVDAIHMLGADLAEVKEDVAVLRSVIAESHPQLHIRDGQRRTNK